MKIIGTLMTFDATTLGINDKGWGQSLYFQPDYEGADEAFVNAFKLSAKSSRVENLQDMVDSLINKLKAFSPDNDLAKLEGANAYSGIHVEIDGYFKANNWTNAKTNEKVYSNNLVVDSIK